MVDKQSIEEQEPSCAVCNNKTLCGWAFKTIFALITLLVTLNVYTTSCLFHITEGMATISQNMEKLESQIQINQVGDEYLEKSITEAVNRLTDTQLRQAEAQQQLLEELIQLQKNSD